MFFEEDLEAAEREAEDRRQVWIEDWDEYVNEYDDVDNWE